MAFAYPQGRTFHHRRRHLSGSRQHEWCRQSSKPDATTIRRIAIGSPGMDGERSDQRSRPDPLANRNGHGLQVICRSVAGHGFAGLEVMITIFEPEQLDILGK